METFSELGIHQGAIDQTMITTDAPPDVMVRVRAALQFLGIVVQAESEYRLRCIRPRRLDDAADPADVGRDLSATGGATDGTGDSSGSSQQTATLASVKPVDAVPLDAHSGEEPVHLPLDTPTVPYTRPHPHPDLHLHPPTTRSRAEQVHNPPQAQAQRYSQTHPRTEHAHHQPQPQTTHPPLSEHAHHQPQPPVEQTRPPCAENAHQEPAQPQAHLRYHTHHVHPHALPPLPPSAAASSASSSSLERQLLSFPDEPYKITYGPFPVDPGDEVRFTVELTRIARLIGTYSLDIRRLKGHLKSYGFLYEEVRNRIHGVL